MPLFRKSGRARLSLTRDSCQSPSASSASTALFPRQGRAAALPDRRTLGVLATGVFGQHLNDFTRTPSVAGLLLKPCY